jgi:hypothetical protein
MKSKIEITSPVSQIDPELADEMLIADEDLYSAEALEMAKMEAQDIIKEQNKSGINNEE